MAAPGPGPAQKAIKRKIRMEDAVRVSEMARQMNLKAQDLMKVLLSMGMMATINQSLDYETAMLVAAEFGHEVEGGASTRRSSSSRAAGLELLKPGLS